MADDAPSDKPTLRRAALARRADAPDALRAAFAERLALEGVALARRFFARTVALFWPVGTEPDTLLLAMACDYHEIIVGLPCAGAPGTPLVFRRWRRGQPLVEGVMRIPEPARSLPEVHPDLIFTPLTAFDRRGYRLGYGGGYYDATLARLRAARPVPTVGVGLSCQEIARVPEEDHDQPLDFILTETELIDCSLAWRASATH
jgi:5-formyltetrahydrofolate cyclo-ligase